MKSRIFMKKLIMTNGIKKVKDFFLFFFFNWIFKYIHDNKNGKIYNIYESFPNFNLTEKHNKLRILRLLKEKGIQFNKIDLDEIMVKNELYEQYWINYNEKKK
jgi:hypothetical protein